MAQLPGRQPTSADLALVSADHKRFDELLRRHQEALVGSEFSDALAALEQLSRELSRHMRLEEDVLIPAYARLPPFGRGGAPEVFLEEHRKIAALLDEILGAVGGLSAGSGTRGAVISLLEREAHFKSLVEHHVRREESFLLPVLRDAFSEAGGGR